jgi:hypothetical protein
VIVGALIKSLSGEPLSIVDLTDLRDTGRTWAAARRRRPRFDRASNDSCSTGRDAAIASASRSDRGRRRSYGAQ